MPRAAVLHGKCMDVPRMEETHRSGRAMSRRRKSFSSGCSDDTGGLRWSPMIGDAPCRSEGEREVSEGRGLGEERLGGRRTKEREESGGASQIPTADGAPVPGRAMGRLDWEGSAQLRWLGRGREGKG
jgi:hypothetical protein